MQSLDLRGGRIELVLQVRDAPAERGLLGLGQTRRRLGLALERRLRAEELRARRVERVIVAPQLLDLLE